MVGYDYRAVVRIHRNYDSTDAEWNVYDQTVKEGHKNVAQGETYTVPVQLANTYPFSRAGYNCIGYAGTAQPTVVKYHPGDNVTITYNGTGGQKIEHLLCVWEEVQDHTVTFNANGGSGAPAAQTKVANVALTLSSVTPTRSGYSFEKWNTAADGSGTDYYPGGMYVVDEDVTLYAQWTVITSTGVRVKGSDSAMHQGTVWVKGSDGNMHEGTVYVKGSDGNMHQSS